MGNGAVPCSNCSWSGRRTSTVANLTAALGFTYEKGRRGGDAAPTSWSSTGHLSRHTIRGLVRSEADFVALVRAGSVAELVNPPKSKTSTHSSEVARRTTTLQLPFRNFVLR